LTVKIIALGILIFIANVSFLYSQESVWHLKGQVAGEAQQQLASATVTLTDKDNKEVLKTITGFIGW
jgi:hypothetical protein